MRITVNGEVKEIEETASLLDVLNLLAIEASTVVVERNATIYSQDDFDSVRVMPNDALEIVRFMGGG